MNFITGGFSDSQDSAVSQQHSELELFKLAKVDFKHGWIISEDDDKEVFEVLLSVANDYDTAVNLLVEGDAIAEGNITGNSAPTQTPAVAMIQESGAATSTSTSEGQNGQARMASDPSSSLTNSQRLEKLFEDLSMEPNKQAKVYQATIIQKFLNNTSTQLTYSGLFKLSESLQPNSLCALFRNSHFSVLYRRPNQNLSVEDPQQVFNSTNTPQKNNNKKLPQATLFQLVTDQALLHEPNAVWESLEDVDGSASQFYDSHLQPAKIRQDWVSRTERDPVQMEQNDQMHDAE